MEIILLQKINKLGNIGDIVHVKPGFGRNYLIPTGRALRASKENKEAFEFSRAKLLEENKEAIEKATKKREDVVKLDLVIVRSASDTGLLYGSVTTRDIASLISDKGVDLNRKQIALEKPIKELGVFDMNIILHPEVECKVELKVVRSLSDPSLDLDTTNLERQLPSEVDNELNEKLLDDGVMLKTEVRENEQKDEDLKTEDTLSEKGDSE